MCSSLKRCPSRCSCSLAADCLACSSSLAKSLKCFAGFSSVARQATPKEPPQRLSHKLYMIIDGMGSGTKGLLLSVHPSLFQPREPPISFRVSPFLKRDFLRLLAKERKGAVVLGVRATTSLFLSFFGRTKQKENYLSKLKDQRWARKIDSRNCKRKRLEWPRIQNF